MDRKGFFAIVPLSSVPTDALGIGFDLLCSVDMTIHVTSFMAEWNHGMVFHT